MSPWVTILRVFFIAPHFPRPVLTPTAFLCFWVRPRKLSFLVYSGVSISLFYHLDLDPQKHWGLHQLSPMDSLLIYRAGRQHIQPLFYARLVEMHHHQMTKTSRRGLNGPVRGSWGCFKVQKNNRITVALIAQFLLLGIEQKAACKTEGWEHFKKSNRTFPVRTEGNSVSNLLLSPNLKKTTCKHWYILTTHTKNMS